MATLLYAGKEFRITHQEMIKGIRKGSSGTNYRYVIKQQGLAKSESLQASPTQWANERVWCSRSPVQANRNPSIPKVRIRSESTVVSPWYGFSYFGCFRFKDNFFSLIWGCVSMMSSFDLLSSHFASIAKPDGNFNSSELWPCAHYSSGRRKKVKSLAAA